MIMAADPQPGNVWRTENTPGLAFEEVTVQTADGAVDGPLGPVSGALTISELHLDGSTEDKTFAPGYGEFVTSGGGDLEALALAVPTDAAGTPVPEELAALTDGAMTIAAAAADSDWETAATTLSSVQQVWESYADPVPARLQPLFDETLAALATAVDAGDVEVAATTALHLARLGSDLQLLHHPGNEVDAMRLDIWLAQLEVDAAAGDAAATRGDYFASDYVRDRLLDWYDPATIAAIDGALAEISGAIIDGDLPAAAEIAASLRDDLPSS